MLLVVGDWQPDLQKCITLNVKRLPLKRAFCVFCFCCIDKNSVSFISLSLSVYVISFSSYFIVNFMWLERQLGACLKFEEDNNSYDHGQTQLEGWKLQRYLWATLTWYLYLKKHIACYLIMLIALVTRAYESGTTQMPYQVIKPVNLVNHVLYVKNTWSCLVCKTNSKDDLDQCS